ncbi:ABC transporter substrate-binding protein [Solirubrobacter sp. CPCC 204708]|uniref:ABC transporter substrate-binding protein n=1 Tax=Solirubrobacter deserti TaxID=2282478 RepID=A0ABT4RFD4_9ACTN|nr:ABC transporter substrate-binding protein [Solirubrobacter deserti]MBE2319490.1 ABC transporter substrate-binding protein [Solirubrobacter deserti]MDA0137223.1 ABC transporter substrate-binding protein [Solirubrobacter deserti]
MAEVSRREFLHRSGIGAGGLLTLSGLSALLAACGGEEETASNSGNGAAKVNPKPKIGLSSSPQASYLPVIAGPIMAGSKFGLNITKSDITTFDSSTTLTQSTLSGQVQIAGQSTVAQLLLIDRGQPFKIFATYSMNDDFVIAGRGDVKTIAQLKDPKVTVASDSPGGAGQAVFDAMLKANNAGFLVDGIPKKVIIESSGERTSALASGDADATVIHIVQANAVNKETGDVNIIAKLYGPDGEPNFMKEAYAARTDWLDENIETAAAVTASVIQASRDLTKDYASFEAACKQLIEEPPPAEELQELFEIIKSNEVYPVDGGLTDERVQYMIDLGKEEGIIETDLTPDKVVDRRVMERALEMVGS